jgi:hypothetical protein
VVEMRKRDLLILTALLLASCALRNTRPSQDGMGDTANLLPDSNILNWAPYGGIESVARSEDIWSWDDGAEQVFVDHHFVRASRRLYQGKATGVPVLLRLRIYALEDSSSAKVAYHDPRSGTGNPLAGPTNPAREARLDESASQALSLEFWKSRYFVRLVIEENSLQAKGVLFQFAHDIAGKIK